MRYQKIIFVLLAVFMFSFAGFVLAQEETDLPDAGLTPKSPFYFLDRFGDWARLNVFTFNAARKAEIKAQIAEERLSELNTIAESDPQRTDIIETLEKRIQKGIDEADADAERLDAENRDVAGVIEKLNNFSIKRQRVLEGVIERVPDEAKDKIEKTLEGIYEKAKKHRDILLKQKEKGFISDEKVGVIIQNGLTNLQNQLELRKERLEEIEDEALKQRLESVIEKKIEALEGEILDVESREDFKEVRNQIIDAKKRVIESILQARKELRLSATTTEETLEQIHEGKIDLKERAEEMIREADEHLTDIENKIQEIKNNNIQIPQNIISLLENARKHLDNAKKAFSEEDYGRAFGAANSAWRNIKNAMKTLERILEVHKNLPEKIAKLKNQLAELENKIKSLGENIPDDVRNLLREAKAEIEKAEQLRSESAFEEAWRHMNIAERIVKKLRHYIDYLVGDDKGEINELEGKTGEEKKDILKRKLEEVKEIKRIERFEDKREAVRSLPATVVPEEVIACPALSAFEVCRSAELDSKCRVVVKELSQKYPRCGFEKILLRQFQDDDEKENAEESAVKTEPIKKPIDENEARIINMTAKQWEFEPSIIRVKRGTTVVLNIKSVDVAHGFSLPEFGVNVDLKSGQTERVKFIASKTGKFIFSCSIFCGKGHSTMTGMLVVE